jgi:hypothetical protein
LIQIKHRHGEIVLSCGRTMPAKQLAVSSRPGTISHVWSPYTWCLTNICVAATPASPDLSKSCHQAHSSWKSSIRTASTVATSLPLDQFASTRDAAPIQLFEYMLDDR